LKPVKFHAVLFSAVCGLLVLPLGLHSQIASESVLYSFCSQANCTDGENPTVGLLQGSDGNFYGTTSDTIFKLTPAGVLTTIYSFCGPLDDCSAYDYPAYPTLIQGQDGNFYGTSINTGTYSSGEVFKLTPSGVFTSLYSFCSVNTYTYCGDGANPGAALVQDSEGNLYGTTQAGSTNADNSCYSGCGTIFKLTLSGILTTLHSFCYQVDPTDCTEGTAPFSPLVQGADGNFYGTSYYGGPYGSGSAYSGYGTIFKITPSGSFSAIYNFGSQTDDGSYPENLVLASDGNFYGAAVTFFKVTPSGTLTVIDSESTDIRQVSLGSDGNFYGVSQAVQNGKVVQITPTGTVTTLYAFCQSTNCADGEISDTDAAFSAPLQGSNGNLYGTTDAGGAHNEGCNDVYVSCGTAYELSLSPALPAPVQVVLSSSQVQPGKPVTASLKVLNAFSLTMQQCYAFQTLNGKMTPLGKVPGIYSSSTQLYTFSTTFTPATAGIYNYAVTCGGVESGFATLTVGDTTQTLLTASSNPVTPPANDTLTATVTRTTGSGTPVGSVTFSTGSIVIGKATLNGSGVATLTASSQGVAAGTYPVVATYSGDSNDVSSTSAAVNVTVQ